MNSGYWGRWSNDDMDVFRPNNENFTFASTAQYHEAIRYHTTLLMNHNNNYRGRSNNYNNRTNNRGYRDFNQNWDLNWNLNTPRYRPNKYRNNNHKSCDNDLELYHDNDCDPKNTEPIEPIQPPLESPIETQVTNDKEAITDMEELTYDFIVVSDSDESTDESNVGSTPPSSKQDKNDIGSLKMNMLSYIKAVDKKKKVTKLQDMPKSKDDECNNTTISFESPSNYVKRKSPTKIKRKEEVVVDSTDNVVKRRKNLCDSSEVFCSSKNNADELVQPDSTTNDKVQPHHEVPTIMSFDAIKALDQDLESLKTYRIDDLEDTDMEENSVVQPQFSPRKEIKINLTKETLERGRHKASLKKIIEDDLEIKFFLDKLDTERKYKFRSKSCDGKSDLELPEDEESNKKRSKSVSDLDYTDNQISLTQFRYMIKLSAKSRKSSTPKHQSNAKKQITKSKHFKTYNKLHLIDLPDDPTKSYAELPLSDPRRNNKKKMIMVKDISTTSKKIDQKSQPHPNKTKHTSEAKITSNPDIVGIKRRKTEDNQGYHSKTQIRRESVSISVSSQKEDHVVQQNKIDAATQKTLDTSDRKRVGKRRRQTEPPISTRKESKINVAKETFEKKRISKKESKINLSKETFERVMIDNIKPFSIKTPIKHKAKFSIHPNHCYHKGAFNFLNIQNEPENFKVTQDIEYLTTKFADYLTLFCLTTKNIKLLSNLHGEDQTLMKYHEEIKEKFKSSCKCIQYLSIDVEQLIMKAYERITSANVGCSVHEIISALKITFDGTTYGLGKEIYNFVKHNSAFVVMEIKEENNQDDDCIIVDVKEENVASSDLEDTQSGVGVSSTTTTSPPVMQSVIIQKPVIQTTVIQTPIIPIPVTQTPITQIPATQTAIIQKSVIQTPIILSSVTQTPIIQTPIIQTPVVQKPVMQSSVLKTPVMQTPMMQTSVMQTPAIQTPIMQTSVMHTPVMQTSVMQTSVMQTPIMQTSAVHTSVMQTPIIQTPAIQTPTIQTPTIQTPTIHTPMIQAPVSQSQTQRVNTNNQNNFLSNSIFYQGHQMNTPIPVHTNTAKNPVPNPVTNINQLITSNPRLAHLLATDNNISTHFGLQERQTLYSEYINQPNNYQQQSVNQNYNQQTPFNPIIPQQQTVQQQSYYPASYYPECRPQGVNNVVYQSHSNPANLYNNELGVPYQNQPVSQPKPFRTSGGIAVRKDLLPINLNQANSTNNGIQMQNKTNPLQGYTPKMNNLNPNTVFSCSTCNSTAYFGCPCKRKAYCSYNCQLQDWVTHCYEHNYRRSQ